MRAFLRSTARAFLSSIGYELRCIRDVAPIMLDVHNVLALDFASVVCRLMQELGREQLTFLQIGAFDGVSSDPLRKYVIQYGWQGVLVEPQPAAYAKLVENYAGQPGLIFKNCAIAETNGEVSLYTVAGENLPAWCGGLASFSRESIEKHEPFAPGISRRIVEVRVTTETFDQLLRQLPLGELDLLQIDTEGFDAQLIAMFPFQQIRPKIIHFERKHLSVRELEGCLQRLKAFGYQFAFDGGEDMLACLRR